MAAAWRPSMGPWIAAASAKVRSHRRCAGSEELDIDGPSGSKRLNGGGTEAVC
jgi:hypothetical protein